MCVLAVALVTACNSSSAVSVTPPTTTPSGAQTTSPSPSPVPLACELPYLLTNGYAPFSAVGFLKLPDGVFQPDASASSGLPPGGVQASPAPGGNQPRWDAQARRWVPVDLSAISPDGQRYIYLAADGLHRVVVATGADSLLYPRPLGVLGGQVLGYQTGAVYIVFPSAVKNGSGGSIANPPAEVGVWRIDLTTSVAARILTSDSDGLMAGGALWSGGSTLVRTDIGTGQQTVWFSDPGQMGQFIGVDNSGLPIVWTFDGLGHLDIWHIESPNRAADIYQLTYAGAPHIFGPERQQGLFVADKHGVWFGASDGLWLYDGSVFRQVSTQSGIPAGPCQ